MAMGEPWKRIAPVSAVRQETGVSFQFRSDAGRIQAALEQVMRLVRLSGCVSGQEIQVEMALHEALSNAVVHGNRRDPTRWVHLRCSCDSERGVSIVVRDEGQGFDVARVSDPTSPEWLQSDHGLGILIMRSYMDDVWFEKDGVEVHLRKHPLLRPLVTSEVQAAATVPSSMAPSHAGS
jgi:serine/threonine-protein kinase RsbW